MKGSGRRLRTNASDFKVWKGEAFSGLQWHQGQAGVEWGLGEGAGEMAPGTSWVRMGRERGDLALDSVVKFGRIPR